MRGRSLMLATVVAVIMALASPVVAAGPTVVQGTNTAPDDLAAVQAAVDASDQVILQGTFDFGEGTLVIDSDTTLRGRGAVIRNGGTPAPNPDEPGTPTITAVEPATDVTIRDLSMEGSADVSIQAEDGVEARITGNTVTMAPTGFAAIVLIGADGSRVSGNTVTATAVGVLVESTAGADVRNNAIEAFDAGLWLLGGVTAGTFTNNTVAIVGASSGLFGVGRTGVFLASFFGPNAANTFTNTTLEGDMTYGYLLGEDAIGNEVFIAPRNLDGATFVSPPGPEDLCGNTADTDGATVIFVGESDFGGPATGNTVENRARFATFIDCGVDNVVR